MKVIARNVDTDYCDYIAEGKQYEVKLYGDKGEQIIDDEDCPIEISIHGKCTHLGGGHWEVVDD